MSSVCEPGACPCHRISPSPSQETATVRACVRACVRADLNTREFASTDTQSRCTIERPAMYIFVNTSAHADGERRGPAAESEGT